MAGAMMVSAAKKGSDGGTVASIGRIIDCGSRFLGPDGYYLIGLLI